MNVTKKILSFAREAGGASAIAPVCKKILDRNWQFLLLAKDYSKDVFRREGLEFIDFPEFSESSLDGLLKNGLQGMPDLLFTSATSLPDLDMTEKYLWRWAANKGIKSVAMLDQWQNYALRFSGCKQEEELAYLPDYIFAMDEFAREEMIKEGIAEDRIVITGQPAFDRIAAQREQMANSSLEIKDRLGISGNKIVVSFVAEAFKGYLTDKLGYDEQSVLELLGNILDRLSRVYKHLNIDFLVKLHPKNNRSEFDWLFSKWPSFNKYVVQNEITPGEMIAISDLVIGMSSVLLLESIAAGKIVVSLQINSRLESQLVAAKTGAIPFITEEIKARKTIEKLLMDDKFRDEYLKNQESWKPGENAAENSIKYLGLILEGEHVSSFGR